MAIGLFSYSVRSLGVPVSLGATASKSVACGPLPVVAGARSVCGTLTVHVRGGWNPFNIPLPPSPVCRVALVTELFEALVYIVEPNRAMQRSYSSHWPVLVYFINVRTAVRYRYILNLGSAIHCQ
jgi:hypothetical protein